VWLPNSSSKFGSHKVFANLPCELHFATGNPRLDGSMNLIRLVGLRPSLNFSDVSNIDRHVGNRKCENAVSPPRIGIHR